MNGVAPTLNKSPCWKRVEVQQTKGVRGTERTYKTLICLTFVVSRIFVLLVGVNLVICHYLPLNIVIIFL